MVNRQSLLEVAKKIELEHCLSFDAQSMDKERILSDSLESLIGALFIDQGINIVSDIIKNLWSEMIKKYTRPTVDPKSFLQEYLQSKNMPLPSYSLLEQSGKSHNPCFKITVHVDLPEKKIFLGQGPSKKKAEQSAAAQALAFIETSSTQ